MAEDTGWLEVPEEGVCMARRFLGDSGKSQFRNAELCAKRELILPGRAGIVQRPTAGATLP